MRAFLGTLLVAVTLVVVGCTDPLGPGDGTIEVTLAVAGVDGGGQSVTVLVGDEVVGTLSGPGTVSAAVESGRRVVRLEGLAANCAPIGSEGTVVTVMAGETTKVTIEVECRAVTGALLIRTLTTGPDLDGALGVKIDGGASQPLLSNGQLLIDGLAAGPHGVELTDLSGNCVPDGGNMVSVSIRVGGLVRDTSYADFRVTCTATTGILTFVVVTTGTLPDPDGYTVDVVPPVRSSIHVRTNDSLVAGRIAAGTYQFILSGLAGNCTGVGPLSQPAVVAAGATVIVPFAVNCAGPGTLRLSTSTTGTGLDPSFDLVVDGMVVRSVGSNATTLLDLADGMHQVGLAGVALNCAVAGSNPRAVTLAEGDTTDVRFEVGCVQPGTIRVGVSVSGPNPDPSFQVSVDGGAPLTVPANSSVAFDVAPGLRSVQLGDIAGNCTAAAPNPASVTVAQGTTVDVNFTVTCVPRPRTGADFIITTTGSGIDPSYTLGICTWSCYYYTPDIWLPVLSNGTVEVDLPAGYHEWVLQDVASNCSGSIYGTFTVTQDQATAVPININCGAPATARVTVNASGPDAPSVVSVRRDGWYTSSLTPGISTAFSLVEGSHQFELVNLPGNCTPVGPNPLTVVLAPGTTTDVNLAVACTPMATIAVTVSVSGTDLDGYFWVEVDGRYIGALVPAGVVATRVAAGTHSIKLLGVDANCSVTGSNPTSITLAEGETRPVAFAVTCQPNPTLTVTVSTTGTNIPSQFLVGIDDEYYYGYSQAAPVLPNGSTSLRLTAGSHWVTLDNVPANCLITSPNNVIVNMVFGAPPVLLNFTVVCQ